MKKKLTTVFATLLMLTMSFALMACGKPSLKEWFSANEAEFTALEEESNSQDLGCTIDILLEDSNVLAYHYTLTEEYDTSDQEINEALVAAYDNLFDSMESTFEELHTQLLAETSEETIVIRMTVFNPDGSELFSRDYTK